MVEQIEHISAIGRSIKKRVYYLLISILIFIGIVAVMFISQKQNVEQYKYHANEFHSKTIGLALEILDEIDSVSIWIHKAEKHEPTTSVTENLPQNFTLKDKVFQMKDIVNENITKLINIQNQFADDAFKSTLFRVIKYHERLNISLKEFNEASKSELLEKNMNQFAVPIRQLQLLHDEALLNLRNSIATQQSIYDRYLFFILIVVLLTIAWMVTAFNRSINAIIAKYHKISSDLVHSRENTETLLRSTDQGICGLDNQGICIFANAACLRLLGYSYKDELIGKDIHELIHHSHENGDIYPRKESKIYKASLAGENIRCDDEVFWRKDGSSIPVEYLSSPIVEGGKNTGSVIAFSDISERNWIKRELLNYQESLEVLVDERMKDLLVAKAEAEQANQYKSEFLGRMSHELRTPMNAILGFGQLLGMESLQGKEQSFLNEIMVAGRHLLVLIDEVLDLAKIESGKINLIFEDFSAIQLIEECISSISPFAAEHGISLSLRADTCKDINLRMDRVRTREVLQNLISNAIKYNSDEGNVHVSCEQVTTEKLRINIADDGPGIEKEEMAMLFEPFNRMGREYGEVEGTGIGLTIAKNLMEVMGGDIGVNSSPTGGSIFWIDCNIGHSIYQNTSQPEKPKFDLEAISSPQYKVLCVEDNQANMRLLENVFLNQARVKFYAAPTAEMGIEVARETIPDIILLDINLPGMDGYEALSRLRNYPETKHIPVIAISAAAMPRDVDRGLTAGFKYYLTKPIQVDELFDVIKSALPRSYLSESG